MKFLSCVFIQDFFIDLVLTFRFLIHLYFLYVMLDKSNLILLHLDIPVFPAPFIERVNSLGTLVKNN